MSAILEMAGERQALMDVFASGDFDDHWGKPASDRLAALHEAILAAPAASAHDVAVKMQVWGYMLQEYAGEIVDNEAEKWARLVEDVATLCGHEATT